MVVVAHRISGDLLAVLRQLTIHSSAGAGGRGSIGSHVRVVVLVGHTRAGAEAVVVLERYKVKGVNDSKRKRKRKVLDVTNLCMGTS